MFSEIMIFEYDITWFLCVYISFLVIYIYVFMAVFILMTFSEKEKNSSLIFIEGRFIFMRAPMVSLF